MPDQKSESSNYQSQPDWRKKGLGWVPDYPDARDYSLGNDNLNKREAETTQRNEKVQNIETLAGNINKLIDALYNIHADKEFNQKLEKIKETINHEIMDNVSFEKVRIYKILRFKEKEKMMSEQEVTHLKSVLCHLLYRDLMSKNYESIELLYEVNFDLNKYEEKNIKRLQQDNFDKWKKKLQAYQEWLEKKLKKEESKEEEEKSEQEKSENDKPKSFIEWLNDPRFDQNTERIVAIVQDLIFLGDSSEVDGIVGLNTYTKLDQKLADLPQPYRFPPVSYLNTSPILKLNIKTQEVIKLKHFLCYLIYYNLTNKDPKKLEDLYNINFDINKDETILKEYNNKLGIYIAWLNKQQGKTQQQPQNSPRIQLVDWLDDPTFDQNTKRMVAIVQNLIFSDNLSKEVDGIVGENTFTKLNEKLANLRPYILSPIFPPKTFEGLQKNLMNWAETISQVLIEEIAKLKEKITSQILIEQVTNPQINSLENFEKDISPEKIEKIYQDFFFEPIISTILGLIAPIVILKDRILEEGGIGLEKQKISNLFNEDQDYASTSRYKDLALRVVKLLNYRIYNPSEKIFLELIQILFEKYIRDCQQTTEWENFPLLDKEYIIEVDKGENSNSDSFFEYLKPVEIHLPINQKIFNKINSDNQKSLFYLPGTVDLSWWCPPVRDQGSLNSCAAFAGVTLLEYLARRSQHPSASTSLSPLFLYKTARNLMNVTEDTGSSVRETMRAMALFGGIPEKYWPYQEDLYNEEPPAFCFSYGQNNQSLKYFRLDVPDSSKRQISNDLLLFKIKAVLVAGFPCIFGLTLYDSVYTDYNLEKGYIPSPVNTDSVVVGGHVVLAVGYDDYKYISKREEQPGAILIRNSWGDTWGCGGYGWLPYSYVLKGLTADWWSLLKSEWFEAGNFGLGAYNTGEGNGGVNQPGGGG